jgi:hypothetical protein
LAFGQVDEKNEGKDCWDKKIVLLTDLISLSQKYLNNPVSSTNKTDPHYIPEIIVESGDKYHIPSQRQRFKKKII